jgi:hypothetical protein
MSRISDFRWPLAAALAFVLLAAPLWFVATPGMPDYPAHLASFALIAGEPSRYYAIHWAALPNLASEFLVPLLAPVTSLENATRLYLTVVVALWVAGPALIQRALFGRIGPGALLCCFFAYNANFIWGFFNYTFGSGLALAVFAGWIATDGRRSMVHLLGFALAFTLIYFSHIFAFAMLLLAIGGYELSGLIAEKFAPRALLTRVLVPALLCIPAGLAYLALKPKGAQADIVHFNLIETFVDRFESAIQVGFDKPALVLTGALIALFIAAVATGRARVHPRMTLVLILFAIAALFMPEWALGGWAVHMRTPPVLGALAFASLEWRAAPRVQSIAVAVTLALIGLCAVLVGLDWKKYDAQYAEFRADPAVKPGGKILAVLDGDSLGWSADQPYWHIAEFAIADRGAFTPLLFTTAGQHVVHIRPPYDRIAASDAQQGSPPDIDELDDLAAGAMEEDEDYLNVLPYLDHFQCHFDQAVVIEGAGKRSRVPAMLRLRAVKSFYRLYDIVADASCRGR